MAWNPSEAGYPDRFIRKGAGCFNKVSTSFSRCERAGELLTSALRLTERIQLIYSQLPFHEDLLVGKVNEIEGHLVALLQKHVTKYVHDASLCVTAVAS